MTKLDRQTYPLIVVAAAAAAVVVAAQQHECVLSAAVRLDKIGGCLMIDFSVAAHLIQSNRVTIC